MTEYSINIHESVFDNIKAEYEAHDKTCSSIPHLWLGSKGGFSCFGEQSECHNCAVTFYFEGLKEVELPDDVEYYCDCCYRAKAQIIYKDAREWQRAQDRQKGDEAVVYRENENRSWLRRFGYRW